MDKTVKRVIVREGLVFLGVIASYLIACSTAFTVLLLIPGLGYPLYLLIRFFVWVKRALREGNKPMLRRVAVVAAFMFILFILWLMITYPNVYSPRTGFVGIGLIYTIILFAIICMFGVILILALKKLKKKSTSSAILFCLILALSVLSIGWAKDIYLSGIMYDNKGKSTAVINDEIVSEGDLIDGYRVKAIKTDMVILVKDGKELKLLVNEPRNNKATQGASSNKGKGLSCAGEVWYQKGAPEDERLGYKFIDDSTVELVQGNESLGRGSYTVNKREITIQHECGTQRLVKAGNILKWVNGPAPIEFERVK